jgi:hypothetical protein
MFPFYVKKFLLLYDFNLEKYNHLFYHGTTKVSLIAHYHTDESIN